MILRLTEQKIGNCFCHHQQIYICITAHSYNSVYMHQTFSYGCRNLSPDISFQWLCSHLCTDSSGFEIIWFPSNV